MKMLCPPCLAKNQPIFVDSYHSRRLHQPLHSRRDNHSRMMSGSEEYRQWEYRKNSWVTVPIVEVESRWRTLARLQSGVTCVAYI